MVEPAGLDKLQISKNSSTAKFKFCFIVRGPPQSGKSTIASHLAGAGGKTIASSHSHLVAGSPFEFIYSELQKESKANTPVLVIEEENLLESEVSKIVELA
jgi:hypothetical protein